MPSLAAVEPSFSSGFLVGSREEGALPAPLEKEIRRSYDRSAGFYGSRFPLREPPLLWSCYRAIPILTKAELMSRGHASFFVTRRALDDAIQRREMEYERTSGSTRSPMTVVMERSWWPAQTARAYRAHPRLAPFADVPHRKAVLAPVGCSSNLCPYEDFDYPARYLDGTIYLNLSSDPFAFAEAEWDRILLELRATKPDLLEGEPTYLSLLARAAQKRKVRLPSLQAVILTYGKASVQHSLRIAEAFPAPQVDLYGSTEAGYLFVGGAFQDDARAIEANAFVELLPWSDSAPELFHLLATTREKEAMPLLRYRTGDLVRRLPTGFRLLGRERDVHVRRDGQVLSSFEIDRALPEAFAAWHVSLVQISETRWDFLYVADREAKPEVAAALADVLGDGARVNLFRRKTVPPLAGGKFALLKPLPRSEPR